MQDESVSQFWVVCDCACTNSSAGFTFKRAVLKPVSSVFIVAEQGEVKVVKSCAGARRAQVRPKGYARLQLCRVSSTDVA